MIVARTAIPVFLMLFASIGNTMMRPIQEGDSVSSFAFIAAKIASALMSPFAVQPTPPREDEYRQEHSDSDVALVQQALAHIHQSPLIHPDQFQKLGNADLSRAQIVIINENPYSLHDINWAMQLLRGYAECGDTVLVEVDGTVGLISLENFYLLRVLSIDQMTTESDSFEGFGSATQKAKRQARRAEHAALLLSMRNEIRDSRFIRDEIAIKAFSFQHPEGPTLSIQSRTMNQVEAIKDALSKHRRVFIIRNRAFSLHYLLTYFERHPSARDHFEKSYSCSLRTLSDLLTCYPFDILNHLSQLHHFIAKYGYAELLLKKQYNGRE